MITRQTALFDYVDKVLAAYLLLMLRKFRKMQNNLLSFDELNAINTQASVNSTYADVLALAMEAFRKVARAYYRKVRRDEDFPLDMWLADLLNGYDPVTYYLFYPEHDRKRARMFESALASRTRADLKKEVTKAYKYWGRQFKHYLDKVAVNAVLEAYKAEGITLFEWVTQKDEKVCAECAPKDGQLYTQKELPPLPLHYNCRCFIIPHEPKK